MLSVKHKYSNSTSARRYPLSYVLSGQYYWAEGSLLGQNEYGGWQSTTANSSNSYVYFLYISNNSLLSQGDEGHKPSGLSLHSIKARRYPLSYVNQVGAYYWKTGDLYNQNSLGHWWANAAYSNDNAQYMIIAATYLTAEGNNEKLYGFSLRFTFYKDFSDCLLAKQMGIIILQLEYGTVNSGAELPRIIIPI